MILCWVYKLLYIYGRLHTHVNKKRIRRNGELWQGSGLVGSFLPSLWFNLLFCGLCNKHKNLFFLLTRASQFCSLVPKYLDSHPVCSDLCLFRIHLFHVLVTMPGAAPTCTQKYLNPLDVNDFMAAAVNNIEFKHLNWSSPKSVNCFSSVICSKSLYAPFLKENNNGSEFFRSYRVAST